jgi:hypothetical protein
LLQLAFSRWRYAISADRFTRHILTRHYLWMLIYYRELPFPHIRHCSDYASPEYISIINTHSIFRHARYYWYSAFDDDIIALDYLCTLKFQKLPLWLFLKAKTLRCRIAFLNASRNFISTPSRPTATGQFEFCAAGSRWHYSNYSDFISANVAISAALSPVSPPYMCYSSNIHQSRRIDLTSISWLHDLFVGKMLASTDERGHAPSTISIVFSFGRVSCIARLLHTAPQISLSRSAYHRPDDKIISITFASRNADRYQRYRPLTAALFIWCHWLR